jgi:hypothetical protein
MGVFLENRDWRTDEKCRTWKYLTLLKNNDVLRIQSEILIVGEEIFRLLARWTTGHNIPGDDDRTLGLSELRLGNGLETSDALSLVLEERLVRWKANVVTAFRGRAAEPRALTTCHQEHADLAIRNGLETDLAPFLCFSGIAN